jgi:arginine/lysine/ornithine decarboxylase
MEASEQPTAPYLDAVVAYAFRGPARYHVPGHKGGPGADPGVRKAIGVDGLAMDIPQDIHGIDLGPSPTPYERAERLAADAYGAARTFFLTNGATQGNHTLCLALAPLGTRIVAQRNSHASIVDGLVLSGGVPSFVAPEYDAELGITHCVTPATLEQALRDAPDARAAFIVSPTYYGMAADIAGMADVAHAAGVPLVVDQSWGPHFGFNEALPPTALSQGADAMLTSTHKIAGSLTQSAMLHISGSGRIDVGAVARALRLLRSTSPSSLLTASLDGARRQLALHGEQLLFETLEAIEVARAKLQTVPGIALVDASLVGRMGVAGYDPLRIVLDVRGTGLTGYEIADALRRSYDVHVELPMQATVVFVVGLGETAGALRRMAGDVDEVVKRMGQPGATAAIVPPATSLRNEAALPPREAFLGEAEQVAVDDAVGRISCESIASYPPGVPALLPGERISAETVTYLRELAASGARLHGASDPAFNTINVLIDGPDARRPSQDGDWMSRGGNRS